METRFWLGILFSLVAGALVGQTRTSELSLPLTEGVSKPLVITQYLVEKAEAYRQKNGMPALGLRASETPGSDVVAAVRVPFLKGDSSLEVVEAALAHWEDRGLLTGSSFVGQEASSRLEFTSTGGLVIFQVSRPGKNQSEIPALPPSWRWGQKVSEMVGARYSGPWPTGGTAYSLPPLNNYPLEKERPQRLIALTKRGSDQLVALLSRHSKSAFQPIYEQLVQSKGVPEGRVNGVVDGDTEPAVIYSWSRGKTKLYQGETFTWFLLTE